jgi:hypothetical protein
MHLTQQIYEEIGDGLVRVTNRDGKSGVFDRNGRWIEGDVRDANTNMLVYTAGPDLPRDFVYRWLSVPADPHRASGWPEHLERSLISAGILPSPDAKR